MIIFFSSLISCLLICGVLIRYRNWHLKFSGDHDLSGPQKFHQEITPRIGGIGIAIGYLSALGMISFLNPTLAKFFIFIGLAALPIFAIGIAEDLTKRIGVKPRLFVAFISGALFLFLFEINSIRLDIPVVDPIISYPVVAILFLAFAIAGLSNAYNIIDGFNGLASMVGIIATIAITLVAHINQDLLVMSLGLSIVGSLIGFFVWNYPKGLIFLGDGGAYLIGFLIALASILLVTRNPSVSPWFALIVNAYPIFETLFTIWRRTIHQRRNPALADGSHFHSLIYRRVIRGMDRYNNLEHRALNAKTSPYLWILSCFGVIPAILWSDSTSFLIISGIVFSVFYIYTYRIIVTFRASNTIGSHRHK